MTSGRLVLVVTTLLCAAPVSAQRLDRETYRDLSITRSRPVGYDSLIKLRGGAAGTRPTDEDEAAGLAEKIAFDGFAFYHGEQVSEQQTRLDAYVGTDGAILSAKDGGANSAGGRLEVSWRYFPFYRDGFYTNDKDWVATGRYEGNDFGAYLGFGGSPDQGITIEGGPFYRRMQFERNDTTASDYSIPDDYNAYGIRTFFEQSTVTLDREFREPVSGFLATVVVEYERNDSDASIGTPLYQTQLASQYWRGLGQLECYFPTSSLGTFELTLEGSWTSTDDRVYNTDTSKPIGSLWADGRLGLRLRFGPIRLIPYGEIQWTKTRDEFGVSNDNNFWYGGGLRTRFDLGDTLALYADFSYLSNPNRTTITFNEDFYGEYQAFAGIEVRFGE